MSIYNHADTIFFIVSQTFNSIVTKKLKRATSYLKDIYDRTIDIFRIKVGIALFHFGDGYGFIAINIKPDLYYLRKYISDLYETLVSFFRTDPYFGFKFIIDIILILFFKHK
ncbi:hypothetical protein M3890_004647 [Vibrio parahaemolyticus]|nr:hypothetical protein [Vibrio parahaemolyticus]HBC3550340.1 hypothetical protein [Vibrio parahaemolyticus]